MVSDRQTEILFNLIFYYKSKSAGSLLNVSLIKGFFDIFQAMLWLAHHHRLTTLHNLSTNSVHQHRLWGLHRPFIHHRHRSCTGDRCRQPQRTSDLFRFRLTLLLTSQIDQRWWVLLSIIIVNLARTNNIPFITFHVNHQRIHISTILLSFFMIF